MANKNDPKKEPTVSKTTADLFKQAVKQANTDLVKTFKEVKNEDRSKKG